MDCSEPSTNGSFSSEQQIYGVGTQETIDKLDASPDLIAVTIPRNDSNHVVTDITGFILP